MSDRQTSFVILRAHEQTAMDSPSSIHLPNDHPIVKNYLDHVLKFRDACVRQMDKFAFECVGEILSTDGGCPVLPTLHLIIKRTVPMNFSGNLEVSQVGYDAAPLDPNRQLRERRMIPFENLEQLKPLEATERHFYEEKSRQQTVKPKLKQSTLSSSFLFNQADNNSYPKMSEALDRLVASRLNADDMVHLEDSQSTDDVNDRDKPIISASLLQKRKRKIKEQEEADAITDSGPKQQKLDDVSV